MYLFFLFLALLFGGFARLYAVFRSPFPLNDGALFYIMTSELAANGFRLPEFSNFNGLHLPFAYPPLGFYLAGLIAHLGGWELLDVFRVLPAVFTVLSIAAFYLLALDLLEDKTRAGLASLIFAFLPAAYDWQIMGGGVTRAPAFFFSLLAMHFIIRMYKGKRLRDVIPAAIFSALTVLSHPETALHTTAAALVFFLFFGRSRRGLIQSMLTAAGVLLLSSPWWLTVTLRHGFAPFTAAGKVGFSGFEWLFKLFTFDLSGEYYVQTIAVFALVGLIILISRKQWLLPVLFLVIFISAPRSATRSLSPVLALAAADALHLLLKSLNSRVHPSAPAAQADNLLAGKLSRIVLGILILQWVISTFTIGSILLKDRTLTPADRAAFSWVSANTPADSQFLILTGSNPLLDPVSEWFPTLSGRRSIVTLYGYEWKTGTDFREIQSEFSAVQDCFNRSAECISGWAQEHNATFDYLLVRNSTQAGSSDITPYHSALQEALSLDGKFDLVYDTPQISIFAFEGSR